MSFEHLLQVDTIRIVQIVIEGETSSIDAALYKKVGIKMRAIFVKAITRN